MKILDKIFNKKEKNDNKNINEINNNPKSQYEFTYAANEDNTLQVDFYDKVYDMKKFYDTTRLIINRQPQIIDGMEVYNCKVSWYGSNDCYLYNPNVGKYINANAENYSDIQTQIDMTLFNTDEEYRVHFMKELLEKKRVNDYLENGLLDNPKQPSGIYIGGLTKKNNEYVHYFYADIGIKSHNSDIAIQKRQERKQLLEETRQAEIRNKQAQIEKLQSDIDNLR